MDYIGWQITIGPTNIIEVTLDRQANVRLMDESNYLRYQRGQAHRYYGGLATVTPFRVTPPHFGSWRLVVDLGGLGGRVNASVRVA